MSRPTRKLTVPVLFKVMEMFSMQLPPGGPQIMRLSEERIQPGGVDYGGGTFNQSAGALVDALGVADELESGVPVRRYVEVLVLAYAADTIGQQGGFPEPEDMARMDEVIDLGQRLLDVVFETHAPDGARLTPAMIAWLRSGMTRVVIPEAEQVEALLSRIEARWTRMSDG